MCTSSSLFFPAQMVPRQRNLPSNNSLRHHKSRPPFPTTPPYHRPRSSRAVRLSCLNLITPFILPSPPPPKDEHLGNADALSRHAGPIPVFELPALPPPELPLEPWYREEAIARGFQSLLGGLAERRAAGAEELAGMKARGRKALWWPFTQHDDLSDGKVNVLDSAYGDYYCVADAEVVEGVEGVGSGEGSGEVRERLGERWRKRERQMLGRMPRS